MNQKYINGYETIIIDNFSSDDTVEFIRNKYNDKVKLVENKERVNLAFCKHMGFQKTLGDIIAFIDGDCYATNDWLQIVKESLENYDFVGGPVLSEPNTRFPWWWKDSLDWMIGINRNLYRKFLPSGCNIAFKRHVLKELEGNNIYKRDYDKDIFPYQEDNYRVKKALKLKYSMMINPNMIVYHCIPKGRLTVKYLLNRSCTEGYSLAIWEREVKTIVVYILAVLLVPLRFLLLWDINIFFRMIVYISYLFHCIKFVVVKK